MKSAIRTLFAVVVGMALALALVVVVELFSAIVHPFPADFNGNMGAHVRRYPHWVLGVVVLAWDATSIAATCVASRVGNQRAGMIVALLLAWALVFNLTKLPYTMWFKIVMFSSFPIACLWHQVWQPTSVACREHGHSVAVELMADATGAKTGYG
jgi:hypothetical protein